MGALAAEVNDPSRELRLGRGLLAASAAGLAACVAAVVVDGRAGYKRWPSAPAELMGMDPETTRTVLTFSGLGSLGGAEQSEYIRRIVPGQGAHWNYSTDRFSVNELAGILKDKAPRLRSATLNGHSLGGPVGMETLRLAGIKFDGILLHCSPFDIKDARNGRVSALMGYCRWPVGPGSKSVFSFTRGILEGRSLRESYAQARFDANNGCSPRVWPHQVVTARSINLAKHAADYQGLVGLDTKVTYFMPEDPDRDTTVNTVQASERFGEFFAGLGVPYEVCRVPDAGHADVGKAVDYYSGLNRAG
jgi:pimeloyl-ACP methyl ester carboxylesterase